MKSLRTWLPLALVWAVLIHLARPRVVGHYATPEAAQAIADQLNHRQAAEVEGVPV